MAATSTAVLASGRHGAAELADRIVASSHGALMAVWMHSSVERKSQPSVDWLLRLDHGPGAGRELVPKFHGK
jgi:hypothetical protein